jgi:hypothetical protein
MPAVLAAALRPAHIAPGVVGVSMATVRLISSLLREIPPTDCPVAERATWFERKAELFDRISSEDRSLADEAARLAQGARAEADRLRREVA